ncbi:MAG: hypothetical protein P1V51_07915 [Deltaproteobacteria bacterium]|nr:hypothetical protein [Deltaproteobacteria bacterium]
MGTSAAEKDSLAVSTISPPLPGSITCPPMVRGAAPASAGSRRSEAAIVERIMAAG